MDFKLSQVTENRCDFLGHPWSLEQKALHIVGALRILVS